MVKAMMAPETMPGVSSGRTTLKKPLSGVQPRSWAASMSEGSSWCSLGMTERMT